MDRSESVFEGIAFVGKWRSYQAQVLEELQQYLDDQRVHVVAAPGSGKTVLGIEVLLRLGQPAVVLTPTLPIRNQWVARLQELFLPPDADPYDWVSTDLRNPKLLTIATYQALFSVWSGRSSQDSLPDEEPDDANQTDDKPVRINRKSASMLVETLKNSGVKTLVLDEAHHLRQSWWRSLESVVYGIEDLHIVSLTATPPYDVDANEWSRYEELCGEIDAEIPVPELVRKNELAPHQDLIHVAIPPKQELDRITTITRGIEDLATALLENEVFLQALQSHPFLAKPSTCEEGILDDPEFVSSLVIFLNRAGRRVPEDVLELLGADSGTVPRFDPVWFERLLQGVFVNHAEIFESLLPEHAGMARDLRRKGVLEGRRIRINDPSVLGRTLGRSIAKVTAAETIIRQERETLGDALRAVVLCDRIYETDLPSTPQDTEGSITRLGCVPIFETLRRAQISGLRIGILTGKLVVLPGEASSKVRSVASALGFDPEHFDFTPLAVDPAYVTVRAKGESAFSIVRVVTGILESGDVHVLIGTQALLGEGWDAPCINTLILATSVGSFMLSNQMRGRAIRRDSRQPDKVANIWHLVAANTLGFKEQGLSPGVERARTRQSEDNQTGTDKDGVRNTHDWVWLGPDFEHLTRRFRAFEGVTIGGNPVIENGIERLNLPEPPWTRTVIENLNGRMQSEGKNRQEQHERWRTALIGRSAKPDLRHAIATPVSDRIVRHRSKLGWAVGTLGIVMTIMLGYTLPHVLRLAHLILADGSQPPSGWGVALGMFGVTMFVALGVGIFVAIKFTDEVRTVWRHWVRFGPIEKSLKGMALALVESLHEAGELSTPPGQLIVMASTDHTLDVTSLHLEGGTRRDRTVFARAMRELLGPIVNPRYLMVRQSRALGIVRTDFHCVPEALGRNQKLAGKLQKAWLAHVGTCRVVYARNAEGRRLLLKARVNSLANTEHHDVKERTVWQ